jgi:hypothetical protein
LLQALDVISWVEAIAFALISTSTAVGWARTRTASHAWLAVAVGLLGAVMVVSRLEQVTGFAPAVLGRILLVAFLASGYVLALFRNSVLPMPRWALAVLFALLVGVSAGTYAIPLPTGLSPAPTVAQWIVVWSLVLLWCACVAEPALRFWIAARGRPMVQRTRLRSLSAGYGAVVVLLLMSLGVRVLVGPIALIDSRYLLATSLAGLATVPLLYVGFAPPR